MVKRQEENRASDSTQRRKAEARDPGIGRLSGQHYGHSPGSRITIGHRDPPRTRVADAKRQQRPPRTNDSTQRRRSDARDPGIGHASGQHSALNPEKQLTFRHRDRCDAKHRTARHRRRRAGRAAARSGTAPTQEACAPGTSQDNTVDITLQNWTIGQARADSSRNFATLIARLHVRCSHIYIVCTRCSHTPFLHTPCSQTH